MCRGAGRQGVGYRVIEMSGYLGIVGSAEGVGGYRGIEVSRCRGIARCLNIRVVRYLEVSVSSYWAIRVMGYPSSEKLLASRN